MMTMKRPFEFKVTPETVKTGKHELHVYLYEDSDLISRERDKLITVE